MISIHHPFLLRYLDPTYYRSLRPNGNQISSFFNYVMLFYPNLIQGNLCKKVPGKKVSGKNLEIKTLEKSRNFLKSLEKKSLKIKSCVLGLFSVRTFFRKLFSKDFFGGYQSKVTFSRTITAEC